MMPTRLPRMYHTFALLSVAGPIGVAVIWGSTVSVPAVQIFVGVILLFGLALGMRAVWAILIIWNSFVALVAAIATVSPFAPHSATILGISLCLLGLLVSPSMRLHVNQRGATRQVLS